MRLEIDIHVNAGDFRLQVEAVLHGRVWGVFGPSGAGKTTLLHAVAGLVRPRQGRIVLGDKVLHDSSSRTCLPVHKRRIGCVFQDNRLLPHLSVEGNLRYARRLAGRHARFDLDRIAMLLDLEPLRKRLVDELSGGEKRRVAIGRALLASPELLLLDEPLTGVDAPRRAAVLSYLGRASEELDLSMLVVSHDLEVILTLTDRLLVLEQGRVAACARYPDALANTPAMECIHRTGFTNVLHLRILDAPACERELACAVPVEMVRTRRTAPALKLPAWRLVGGNGFVHAALRACDIALALGPIEHISMQNQMRGTITSLHRSGASVMVGVDIGIPLVAEVTAQAAIDMGVRPGQSVWVLFKAHAMRRLAEWTSATAQLPQADRGLGRAEGARVSVGCSAQR